MVYALAQATGQTGRFTLIERWRTNERLLAPYENPLKVIVNMKFGIFIVDLYLDLTRLGYIHTPDQVIIRYSF